QSLSEKKCARGGEEHSRRGSGIARSSNQLRLAGQRPATGEHDRTGGSARNHERTARRVAGGASESSRRGGWRGKRKRNQYDHERERARGLGSARGREHGKLRCADRALAAAVRFGTNQRCAGSGRRRARHLLPVVSSLDEEVRVVGQLSAVSSQLSDIP